ncbi:DUF4296 domain-containing protein [Pinibacter soli]|uniref:DUF4296 domain-containing protein n=1 Tax=Pinibacter soli TaxID=3044211 RepID=A0ABT6RBV4_9BACT|nr:DUF4296 domain-containing protein [Pinibacter soli]MDI3320058.1 DUF4296 domain-containing protein [Pinibacter soli]
MYKTKYWLFALVIFLGSCGGKNKVPSGVLQKDSMQSVIKDLMRVDEFVTIYVGKDSSKNQKLERLRRYEQVFALHKTSQPEFKKSLDYYREQPEMLKDIFDSVSTRDTVKVDTAKNHLKPLKPDSAMVVKHDTAAGKINRADSLPRLKFRADTAILRRFKKLNQK